MKNSYVAVAFAAMSTSVAGAQVTIDWVAVGNAGNAPDPTTGFGAVGYEYRIGATEVTNAQYAAFLNAAAKSDPTGLYCVRMGTLSRGGIVRAGSDGDYAYTVRRNMGDKPVNFVSWYDVARMCNWMSNGQGSGGTEFGVYDFDGETSISSVNRDLRTPSQVFIPNEDEWYKAAYHHPASQGGDHDDYWLYATRCNNAPIVAMATPIGDVANPGDNVANYRRGADWDGVEDNLTTIASAGSTSYYGAFDMNGNVWEWIEDTLDSARGLRGGSLFNFEEMLRSSTREFLPPTNSGNNAGIRLASPAPTTGPCTPADLAEPFNQLDIADVVQYLQLFGAADPAADLSAPTGTYDIADVVAFLQLFGAGCP